jgi:arylsulfatase A-like enzyme
MDAQIGELLDGYKAARPNSVPLIIVVADHGESFLEHGIIFDHGDDLYDPTMRVPLIVSGGGFPRDVVSDCLVSTVDIFPTVLGVVGLSKEDGVGRSLKKALAIAGECPERKIYGSTVGSRALNPPIHHMVRGSTDKFLQLTETDERYFDLTRDPQELSPISDTRMGRLRLLKKYLSMKLDNQVNAKERQDEAEVLKGLQQLGYVDQP